MDAPIWLYIINCKCKQFEYDNYFETNISFHKKKSLVSAQHTLCAKCAKRRPSFLWKLILGYNVKHSMEKNSIGPVHDLS